MILVNDNDPGDEYSQQLYKLLEEYTDNRLILLEQERHINGAAARNAGIHKAKGEFIAFLDDDDFWELQKIERQVKLINTLDESWGAVSCLMRIYKKDKLIEATMPYRDGNILVDILDRKTSMGTGSLLIRHTALDNVGYFDENLYRHQDLQLFACLAEKYKIKLDKVYLHNRDIDDAQNRLDAAKMIEVKKAFFTSISDIMGRLNKSDQKKVLIMHDFEIAYHIFKSGDKKRSICLAMGVLKTPATIYLAFDRIFRRLIQSKFCGQLEKRYMVNN